MHNWDYPKTSPPADETWRLERLLTYGLNGEKIKQETLEKYFDQLKIPEDTRAFLELLVWQKPF